MSDVLVSWHAESQKWAVSKDNGLVFADKLLMRMARFRAHTETFRGFIIGRVSAWNDDGSALTAEAARRCEVDVGYRDSGQYFHFTADETVLVDSAELVYLDSFGDGIPVVRVFKPQCRVVNPAKPRPDFAEADDD